MGGGLPQCMLGYTPPGCGLGDPPGCGPGDPPCQTPQLPLWVWAWRPPPWRPARHAGIPPARHAGIPPLRPAARHAGIPPAMHTGIPPPVNRITDTCKNITLPQLRCVEMHEKLVVRMYLHVHETEIDSNDNDNGNDKDAMIK